MLCRRGQIFRKRFGKQVGKHIDGMVLFGGVGINISTRERKFDSDGSQ